MNLKQLNFGHIEGFSDLSKERQDEFIALFKNYVKNRDLKTQRKDYIAENQMTSVQVTGKNNYRVSFHDRSDIVLKPDKKPNKKESAKEKIPSIQVRISASIHQEIKKLAEQENLDMREIIDIACRQYIDQYDRK